MDKGNEITKVWKRLRLFGIILGVAFLTAYALDSLNEKPFFNVILGLWGLLAVISWWGFLIYTVKMSRLLGKSPIVWGGMLIVLPGIWHIITYFQFRPSDKHQDSSDALQTSLDSKNEERQQKAYEQSKQLFDKGLCPGCGAPIDQSLSKCLECGYDFYENRLLS